MASGEGSRIAAILTEHFVGVDIRGKESSSDAMIDSVLRLKIDRTKREVATTLTSLEESNDVARVVQHYAMTSTAAAVAPGAPVRLQTLSADTWLRTAGEWRLAKTETLELEVVTGSGSHRYVRAQEQTAPPTRYPLLVTARMWEYIKPISRGERYEDPLDAFLVRHGLGEVDGGGTQLGDEAIIDFVDVVIWLRDSEGSLDRVAEELGRLGAPIGSELQFTNRTKKAPIPFGSTECLAIFLDGVTLPADVYKTNDVNVVLERLEAAIAVDVLGEFRDHWRGPRETALFFNGKDAEAMRSAMLPVLMSEPLCQNSRVIVRYGHHPDGPMESRISKH